MTFEGQYLTYAEYQALGGSAIGEMPFNLLEFEARRQLDVRTLNRLQNTETIPQAVKICMFNLINTIQHYTNETDRTIASESVGSYSVNYKDNISQIIENKNQELNDIITNDLFGIFVNGEHIIYLGVD